MCDFDDVPETDQTSEWEHAFCMANKVFGMFLGLGNNQKLHNGWRSSKNEFKSRSMP
jgi:hypothetical protein